MKILSQAYELAKLLFNHKLQINIK